MLLLFRSCSYGRGREGHDASDFVQGVTPFPLSKVLLLLLKQSHLESVLLQTALSNLNKQNQTEDSIKKAVHPPEPLAFDHSNLFFTDRL